MEIDKIHGVDLIASNKGDVKFVKLEISLAPEEPKTLRSIRTVEELERKLLELEMKERARSIDIKSIMTNLQEFQLDYFKRLEELESKLDKNLTVLSIKCDKLEKVVQRYK